MQTCTIIIVAPLYYCTTTKRDPGYTISRPIIRVPLNISGGKIGIFFNRHLLIISSISTYVCVSLCMYVCVNVCVFFCQYVCTQLGCLAFSLRFWPKIKHSLATSQPQIGYFPSKQLIFAKSCKNQLQN